VAGITPHPTHRDARPSRATRAAALACGLLLVLPVLASIAPEARAAEPTRLLTVPRLGEFQPVRGDNFLAWQQNSRSNPNQYDVYARSLDDGQTFKVNPRRTNGANGDIDGDTLVYQQFRGGRSDLRFFDLVGRDQSSPPRGVNTGQWEYWPSMSGDRLLFGRLYDNGLRRIILFDLSDNTSRRLDQSRRGGSFVDLAPGQVDGDYAVWYKCTSTRDCDVFRYHIPDGAREKIPNQGGRQHAPSVTPDGTVFFARSRGACGSGVRLLRRPLEGKALVLTTLPAGDDIGSTRAYVNAQGVTTVAYDHFECGEPAASDAFEIGEDFSPELTVKLEGNGSGIVTSSPAGINCGTDCRESYDMGTGVTLTAEPRGDAAFAGWSGACTGTEPTCTLQMNGSRTVTATFTNKPVLTVTKSGSGQGTVTSSPAGIDCGTDCNQPYDRGTNVTLTAVPNQNSTFGGWSGACGGNSTTCNVAMTDSKSVTATFTTKPVLTVSTSGDGSVTSSPGDIDCPGDCSDAFVTGTDVTLTADPDPGRSLDSWGGACSGSALTCTVDMDASKSVSATFTADPVQLTVSLDGDGSGTVTGSEINCPGDCTGTYAPGTDVTLTATADVGSLFDDWTGCDASNGNECTMDMTTDKSVTASFDDPLIMAPSRSTMLEILVAKGLS
jgi:hypothetical protein